jgi:hypothetical protein
LPPDHGPALKDVRKVPVAAELRLKLVNWDENDQKLIGFPELRSRQRRKQRSVFLSGGFMQTSDFSFWHYLAAPACSCSYQGEHLAGDELS